MVSLFLPSWEKRFIFFKGKNSPIKCKQEAFSPRLIDFIEVLGKFWNGVPLKKVQVVTDDPRIQDEISQISKEGIAFMKSEPAPKRIPDKVRICNSVSN